MYINTAEQIQGIPSSSWPGADLDIGSSGQKVWQLEQLNLIGDYYTAIPALTVYRDIWRAYSGGSKAVSELIIRCCSRAESSP